MMAKLRVKVLKKLLQLLRHQPSKITKKVEVEVVQKGRNQKNYRTQKSQNRKALMEMMIIVMKSQTVLLKRVKGAGSLLAEVVGGAAHLQLQRKEEEEGHPGLKEEEEDQRRHK